MSRAFPKDVMLRLSKSKNAAVGALLILCIALIALLAPVIAPHDPFHQSLGNRLKPPSTVHLFGTDAYGRDNLSRIIYGSRISLTVGVIAVGISLGAGLFAGLCAGYFGGILDEIVMRIVDIIMSFPSVLLAIVIVSVLGPSLFNAMIAIGISSIPTFARLARGSTLSVREREYVEAVRALGASMVWIVGRHIFPNILAPLTVVSSLSLARTILSAAALSFLGLGAQPPTPDWGAMLNTGRTYMLSAWWVSVFPGLAIMVTVLGFNLLGDGLRDVLDPKLKRSLR